MTNRTFEDQIRESLATKQRLLERCVPSVDALCDLALTSLRAGGKIMLCGNGGSSCDAAHAAGELVGWFENRQRGAIPAIALGHEVPALTAIANDSSYDEVFARQIEALGRREDLVIGISTSGGSRNVLRALEVARDRGMSTAAMVAEKNDGGPIAKLADVAIKVPSSETPRIQEGHLLVLHMMCATLEAEFAQ